MHLILLDPALADLREAKTLPCDYLCRVGKRGHKINQAGQLISLIPAETQCVVTILGVTDVTKFLLRYPNASDVEMRNFIEIFSVRYDKFLEHLKTRISGHKIVVSGIFARKLSQNQSLADTVTSLLNCEIHHLATSKFLRYASLQEKFGLKDLFDDFH